MIVILFGRGVIGFQTFLFHFLFVALPQEMDTTDNALLGQPDNNHNSSSNNNDDNIDQWPLLRSGDTVMENARVKVEMMETCQDLFPPISALSAAAAGLCPDEAAH